ncbi:hypothetical protein [Priestia megaterium]|uniref:hypothetical protein n=1 Tax=Priestia megaterium TaxID=1404 RepID=UPI0028131917|nr:hypothetical protein [Priestia megaterium]MDR0132730.1 hypothetical protein [Priestia megaterium]
MIKENYEHWHVDYYNEELDFLTTATGFYDDIGTWEIFFDEYRTDDLYKILGSNCDIDKDLGVFLFRANDFNEAQEKFSKWVETVLIPYIKANPKLKTKDT